MNRSTLIAKLAEQHPQFSERDIARCLDAILDAIAAELAAGGRVELNGFGVFEVIDRPARAIESPGTAKASETAQLQPRVSAGKAILLRIDDSSSRWRLPAQAQETSAAIDAGETASPVGRVAKECVPNEQAAQAVDEMIDQMRRSKPIRGINLKALRQAGRS